MESLFTLHYAINSRDIIKCDSLLEDSNIDINNSDNYSFVPLHLPLITANV